MTIKIAAVCIPLQGKYELFLKYLAPKIKSGVYISKSRKLKFGVFCKMWTLIFAFIQNAIL